jgi:hypothetical protein
MSFEDEWLDERDEQRRQALELEDPFEHMNDGELRALAARELGDDEHPRHLDTDDDDTAGGGLANEKEVSFRVALRREMESRSRRGRW